MNRYTLSDYANDPAFPATTSNVKEMLKAANPDKLIKNRRRTTKRGIMIGEAVDENDLNYWVEQADGDTLLAGASNLFNKLLQQLFNCTNSETIHPGIPQAGVCLYLAVPFTRASLRLITAYLNNIALHYVPAAIICNEDRPAIDHAFLPVMWLQVSLCKTMLLSLLIRMSLAALLKSILYYSVIKLLKL
jgi:hypothetical protein